MRPPFIGSAAGALARMAGITARDERRLIRAAYAALLGRDPDGAEIAHWQAHLADGMTWARFLTLMRNAPEYTGGQLRAIAGLDGDVEVSLLKADPVPGARLRFRVSAGDTVILPSLIDTGGVWEPHVTRAIRALAGPGDAVVDAGANAGYFTVLAGGVVGPQGRVLALEPAEEPRAWCEQNIALNDHAQSDVLPLGLWSEPATLQIRVVPHATTAGHLVTDPSTPIGENEVAFEVACTSLDALSEEGRIPPGRLRLVKLVVQGSEPAALRGMRRVAAAERPAIICHVNAGCLEALGSGPGDIAREIDALGYRMVILPKDHQAGWFDDLRRDDSHPALGLRRVDDLEAAMNRVPAADDPVDIIALPA